MLLKPAKCQGFSTVSELLKENQQGGGSNYFSPPKLGLNASVADCLA